MYVHGQIETENIIALVDTGASGLAFVSRTLCDRFRQNPLPLLSPIALVGFEGDGQTFFRCVRHIQSLFTIALHVGGFSAVGAGEFCVFGFRCGEVSRRRYAEMSTSVRCLTNKVAVV